MGKFKTFMRIMIPSLRVTRAERRWMKEHLPKNKWWANVHGLVFIEGDVNLVTNDKTLPVKIGFVCGDFFIRGRNLEDCENFPSSVCGNFKIIESLCESLKGSPSSVGKSYTITDCPNLKTLEHVPPVIKGNFSVHNTGISDLTGFPKTIKRSALMEGNSRLVSLEGADTHVVEEVTLIGNNIKSVKNIHNHFHTISGKSLMMFNNPIKSGFLDVLRIKSLRILILTSHASSGLELIINKHIGSGRSGMLVCQRELIEEGYEHHV